jgi:hypothetical protein
MPSFKIHQSACTRVLCFGNVPFWPVLSFTPPTPPAVRQRRRCISFSGFERCVSPSFPALPSPPPRRCRLIASSSEHLNEPLFAGVGTPRLRRALSPSREAVTAAVACGGDGGGGGGGAAAAAAAAAAAHAGASREPQQHCVLPIVLRCLCL